MREELQPGPIGIFDSGYGGLTILKEIQELLPQYSYIYLGDNSRAPYGGRSFEVVYEFTRQAVTELFARGCNMIILACNTASAKALRTIQQSDLPSIHPQKRVLGIIRPTIEIIDHITRSKHVGILGTQGTIQSNSYRLEIEKLFPNITVTGQSCPIWVSLVENGEYNSPGADYFIRKDIDTLLSRDPLIDTLILACTHFPLLISKIEEYTPKNIRIVSQGRLVANSLNNYLCRHPEMEALCTQGGSTVYLTTESEEKFTESASTFLKYPVVAKHIVLN